jgi:hypothetical protein
VEHRAVGQVALVLALDAVFVDQQLVDGRVLQQGAHVQVRDAAALLEAGADNQGAQAGRGGAEDQVAGAGVQGFPQLAAGL